MSTIRMPIGIGLTLSLYRLDNKKIVMKVLKMDDLINVRFILVVILFLSVTTLMIMKKIPTMLALPFLGIAIAAVAGVPFMEATELQGQTIMTFVITKGVSALSALMTVSILGSIFSKIVELQGISSTIIDKTIQTFRDRPLSMVFALSATAMLVFSAITGAGAIIMVSAIVAPLFLSVGMNRETVAGLLLMSFGTGSCLNVARYQLFAEILKMDMDLIKESGVVLFILCGIMTGIYIFCNCKNLQHISYEQGSTEQKVKTVAMLTPLVPLVLVFFFQINAETSLLVSIVYGVIFTAPDRFSQVLTTAALEGTKDVAGLIVLIMGIGILLNGMTATKTTSLIGPDLAAILPTTAFGYVLFFTLLSPLALYRGPFNLFGMGAGLSAVMLAVSALNPVAMGMALRATSVVQGISDPTNTQNVIVAEYSGVDVNATLKKTLPYSVTVAFLMLIYTVLVYGV